jgi:hypothetical protein
MRALLAMAVGLPFLGALGGCGEESTCPEDLVGFYNVTWDLDSLDDRPGCRGVESATIRIVSAGGGLQVRYLGYGPFDVTEADGELTWTEVSTGDEFGTTATYTIALDGCNVSGDGVFTRTFLEDGSTCDGVARITGHLTP